MAQLYVILSTIDIQCHFPKSVCEHKLHQYKSNHMHVYVYIHVHTCTYLYINTTVFMYWHSFINYVQLQQKDMCINNNKILHVTKWMKWKTYICSYVRMESYNITHTLGIIFEIIKFYVELLIANKWMSLYIIIRDQTKFEWRWKFPPLCSWIRL